MKNLPLGQTLDDLHKRVFLEGHRAKVSMGLLNRYALTVFDAAVCVRTVHVCTKPRGKTVIFNILHFMAH